VNSFTSLYVVRRQLPRGGHVGTLGVERQPPSGRVQRAGVHPEVGHHRPDPRAHVPLLLRGIAERQHRRRGTAAGHLALSLGQNPEAASQSNDECPNRHSGGELFLIVLPGATLATIDAIDWGHGVTALGKLSRVGSIPHQRQGRRDTGEEFAAGNLQCHGSGFDQRNVPGLPGLQTAYARLLFHAFLT
jgi:hypothetical protein